MSTACPGTCGGGLPGATHPAAPPPPPHFAIAPPRRPPSYPGGRHPSGRLRLRAVLGDRLTAQPILVRGRAPAAVDDEPDAVVCGIRRRPAQRVEEGWIEPGDARDVVIEDRRGGGDGTVGLAER